MRICRVQIKNFRNFENLDVELGNHIVIVGENRIGKSNFLYALRLVLDPSLPDSARQLQRTDYWNGIETITKDDKIMIRVYLTDFDKNPNLMALLAEHLVNPEPMIACLTYVFQPKATLNREPKADADFEFFLFGGNREENRLGYEIRRQIPLEVLPALRDAERDLSSWNHSPLRPLLDKAAAELNDEVLREISDDVLKSAVKLAELDEINSLGKDISKRLEDMVGSSYSENISLGLTPTDPAKLIRSIRLLIDNGLRGISEASLGSANLIYLALKSLELKLLTEQGNRHHTILCIEEPEAHLHPHLQRLVYRDFLRPRKHLAGSNKICNDVSLTVLLTTHSPHVASIAPIDSLVLLRKSPTGKASEAVSTYKVAFSKEDVADLERYLDVTRGEMLFAKGIILVEGDAEEYVVPTLGRLLGYDFDALGLTVCSVSGVNFIPYIKLLGKKGLNLPFAILTDYDPQEDGKSLGCNRVLSILQEIMGDKEYSKYSKTELLKLAPSYGVFLNEYTFEVDLFKSGHHKSMCKTLKELTDNEAIKQRANNWSNDPLSLDAKQFLKDISTIGKGRYAQRLTAHMRKKTCPAYIKGAIEYVANLISQ